jgi:hypothetical protein
MFSKANVLFADSRDALPRLRKMRNTNCNAPNSARYIFFIYPEKRNRVKIVCFRRQFEKAKRDPLSINKTQRKKNELSVY